LELNVLLLFRELPELSEWLRFVTEFDSYTKILKLENLIFKREDVQISKEEKMYKRQYVDDQYHIVLICNCFDDLHTNYLLRNYHIQLPKNIIYNQIWKS
jgi:hypothetical protein